MTGSGRLSLRLLLALFGLLAVVPCAAQPGPLVIILLPKTGLADWQRADAPNLHRLMSTGALAVMNTRTARRPDDRVRETPESAALTLGAGARAAAGPETAAAYPPRSIPPGMKITAGALYTRRTGWSAPLGEFVNIAWPRVIQENTGRGYEIRPGNLGDALRRRGVSVFVGGGPLSVPMGLRSDGTVPYSTKIASPLRARPSCWIWDAGDDASAADSLLQSAADAVQATQGCLLVISPCVGDIDYAAGARLSPVLLWGTGVPSGVLYSPSTRQAGLVTNTDVAPTVAAYFHTRLPVRAFGDVWQLRAMHESENVVRVSLIEATAAGQARAMRILPYLALVLGIWLFAGTLLFAGKRTQSWMALFPVVLLLSLLAAVSVITFAVWIPVLAAALYAAGRRFGVTAANRLGLALLAGLLITDLCVGDPLMRRGLLGYSAIEGARYYGMGNEAMGALIGAVLISTARLWRQAARGGRPWLVLGLVLVAALLGSPMAGAKAGGLLVSILAFSTLVFQLNGGTARLRVLAVVLLAGLALAAVALADASAGSGQQSHMGQAITRIRESGPEQAVEIITRKLSVEGRLLYHSAWAFPLWGGLAGWLLLNRRPGHNITDTGRALRFAGWVAIAACLTLNDAGVVAGALCVSLLWGDALAHAKPRPADGQETVS